MGSTERRNAKVTHDSKTNKVILIREHFLEMDLTDVSAKINEVKNSIAQMEYHAQRIEAELKNARQELVLLQGMYADGK